MSTAYLSQKLTRPLPTKDGGTLRTVLDARSYMLALSKARERDTRWQRAAELLLAEADVADLTRQVDLALFYDAKLDVSKVHVTATQFQRSLYCRQGSCALPLICIAKTDPPRPQPQTLPPGLFL